MRTPLRVWFVTSIFTPFWKEFCEQILKSDKLFLSVAVTSREAEHRGKHWANPDHASQSIECFDGASLSSWMACQFNRLNPDVVIVGGFKIEAERIAWQLAKSRRKRFGYFLEQPTPGGFVGNSIKSCFYSIKMALRQPDFILAVGDRAVTKYKSLVPDGCQVIFFPYYQKRPEPKRNNDLHFRMDNQVTFLFSGRLLPRNSIKEMVTAFEILSKTHSGKFNWCVSAFGPEESVILEASRRSVSFNKHMYFDRNFDSWDDRLRPFRNSEFLLLPSKHSGWGLVVPEALSLGLGVITTDCVEAARYYVDDYWNGLFVQPNARSILGALQMVIDDKDLRDYLKSNTENSAIKGDVAIGVLRFERIMKSLCAC